MPPLVLVELRQPALLDGGLPGLKFESQSEAAGFAAGPGLILLHLFVHLFTIVLQRLSAVAALFLKGFDMSLLLVKQRRHVSVALTRLAELPI